MLVVCIAVSLLQLSFAQEPMEDIKTSQEVDTILIFSEYTEPITYIEPRSLDDDDSAHDVPLSNDEDTDLEPSIVELGDFEQVQETNIISCGYDAEINTSSSDDTTSGESVEAAPINNVRLSSPVKAGGKVTIVAHFGCDGEEDHSKNPVALQETDNDLDGVPEEAVVFGGPVHAQGKVVMRAHYGCGEDIRNLVELQEADKVMDEVPDEAVIFGGPVHAQGKVIVGTHYGCGAPLGISPVFLPLPWFYPHPLYYPSLSPRAFLAQHPLPLLETVPFTSASQYPVSDLPASILADPVDGASIRGMGFNGVVPASGSVKIAARF